MVVQGRRGQLGSGHSGAARASESGAWGPLGLSWWCVGVSFADVDPVQRDTQVRLVPEHCSHDSGPVYNLGTSGCSLCTKC